MASGRQTIGRTRWPARRWPAGVRALALVLALLLPLGTDPGTSLRAATEPEDELRAAVVLTFLRYSEWPADLRSDTLTVCVEGRHEFARLLAASLEGKSAGSRRIHVLELGSPADASCCHVLYVAATHNDEIRGVLSAPHPPHLLTIGEADHFLDLGGAVNLLTVDGHMSFEVDLRALDRAGVTVSSKLLRFGQVRNAGRGGRS